MPPEVVKSINDISLATVYSTDPSSLTVDRFEHFESHLEVLQNAINMLGCKKLRNTVKWSNFSEIEKVILTKFIRQIQEQSPLVWFSSLSLTGPFWEDAIMHVPKWIPFKLDLNPDEPPQALLSNDSLGKKEEEDHRFGFGLLGDQSILLQYHLANDQKWTCLINPHVRAFYTLGSLPSIDAAIITDYDSEAISFLQIYRPTFFFPIGDEKGRYLIYEKQSRARLVITYFPPSCKGGEHSGSWIFSFPCTTKMKCFSHIVVLGRDFDLEDCRRIKKTFSEVRTAFLPVDSPNSPQAVEILNAKRSVNSI